MFGYEINVYSDHKNLVYNATISELQRVMQWRIILKEYASNIKHIAGKNNIVADILSRLLSANTEREEPSTDEVQTWMNEMFNQARGSVDDKVFPLESSTV